jgi:hypothetical protein
VCDLSGFSHCLARGRGETLHLTLNQMPSETSLAGDRVGKRVSGQPKTQPQEHPSVLWKVPPGLTQTTTDEVLWEVTVPLSKLPAVTSVARGLGRRALFLLL